MTQKYVSLVSALQKSNHAYKYEILRNLIVVCIVVVGKSVFSVKADRSHKGARIKIMGGGGPDYKYMKGYYLCTSQ